MDKILAIFIDAFKAKNPRVWGVIAVVLMVVQYGITQGKLFGVFPIEGTLQEVYYWLNWFVTLMIGSRTTAILNPPLATVTDNSDEEKLAPRPLSDDNPIQFLLPENQDPAPVPKNKGGRPRKN